MAKTQHLLLPGPLETRDTIAQKQLWQAGGKEQESAFSWGGLECALWSGLPGTQVSCDPGCPIAREASCPLHSLRVGRQQRAQLQEAEVHRVSLSFLFPSGPMSSRSLLPNLVAAVSQAGLLGSWSHRLKAAPKGLMGTSDCCQHTLTLTCLRSWPVFSACPLWRSKARGTGFAKGSLTLVRLGQGAVQIPGEEIRVADGVRSTSIWGLLLEPGFQPGSPLSPVSLET